MKHKTKRQIATELKEISEELQLYDVNISAIESNIQTIERKKSRLHNILTANQTRHQSIIDDTRALAKEFRKTKKITKKVEVKDKKEKESLMIKKKEKESIKTSITEQINSVTENIKTLRDAKVEWENQRFESLHRCAGVKDEALRTFFRWMNISVPTQLWLSNEVNATKSMAALADLQGLVGEWSALRAIAAEIQIMGDSRSSEEGVSGGKQVYSPGLLHLLKEKIDQKSLQLMREADELRRDVAALEKERRLLHTRLLDVVYYLEEDCKYTTARINSIVSTSMSALSSINHDTEDINDITNEAVRIAKSLFNRDDTNIVEGGDSKSRSSSARVSRGAEGPTTTSSRTATTATSRTATVTYDARVPPSTEDPQAGRRTDAWLESLVISNRLPLVRALRSEIQRDGRESVQADVVNFISKDTSHSYSEKKNSIEDVRYAVVALETKNMWRYLQRAVNNVAYVTCKKAKNEWNAFALNGSSNNIAASQRTEAGNRNNNYSNFYSETGEVLAPKSKQSADNKISEEKTYDIFGMLREATNYCSGWHRHRQLCSQVSMATESIFPASPAYLLHRALVVIKKPKARKNKSLIHDNKDELIQILKARAEEIKETKKQLEKNKEDFSKQHAPSHSHLTETERRSRRKERNMRIKLFQLKLKGKRITNASSFALMSEHASRRLTEITAGAKKANKKPVKFPDEDQDEHEELTEAPGVRPSVMAIVEEDTGELDNEDVEGDDDFDEEDDEDDDDEEEEDGGDDQSLESNRNRILSEIADTGIMPKSGMHSVPLVGENSFAEKGLHQHFEPKPGMTAAETAKLYANLIEKIDKDLNDQIVTQLTVRMGPEPVSVVVFWQPFEDRLKIKVYCFNRNEEYTCYVDQFIVKDLFETTKYHTNAAKIQSLYTIHRLIERMTIESVPRSQALNMSMVLKSAYPQTTVPTTPVPEKVADEKVKKSKNTDGKKMSTLLRMNFNESVFLAKTLNNEEEEKIHVLTLRSVKDKAKVKTSDWEHMLSALPMAHRPKGNEGGLALASIEERNTGFRKRSTMA